MINYLTALWRLWETQRIKQIRQKHEEDLELMRVKLKVKADTIEEVNRKLGERNQELNDAQQALDKRKDELQAIGEELKNYPVSKPMTYAQVVREIIENLAIKQKTSAYFQGLWNQLQKSNNQLEQEISAYLDSRSFNLNEMVRLLIENNQALELNNDAQATVIKDFRVQLAPMPKPEVLGRITSDEVKNMVWNNVEWIGDQWGWGFHLEVRDPLVDLLWIGDIQAVLQRWPMSDKVGIPGAFDCENFAELLLARFANPELCSGYQGFPRIMVLSYVWSQAELKEIPDATILTIASPTKENPVACLWRLWPQDGIADLIGWNNKVSKVYMLGGVM